MKAKQTGSRPKGRAATLESIQDQQQQEQQQAPAALAGVYHHVTSPGPSNSPRGSEHSKLTSKAQCQHLFATAVGPLAMQAPQFQALPVICQNPVPVHVLYRQKSPCGT